MVLAALCCVVLPGCRKVVGTTTVEVKDSVRHYYPVIAGQVLNLSFVIKNTGDQPLVIRDVQASCGCIFPDKEREAIRRGGEKRMLLPGNKTTLFFKYESAKNIGYVEHEIRIYCNAEPRGIVRLLFDVNVVPQADYTRDYEELYKEAVERSDIIRGLVDGDESEKGYYVDIEHDSRSGERRPWRDTGE